jgi:hypothetical protein
MLLALIVWERCEVLLLKSLCADIRQVAFYSIAFSLGNYLLLSSTIFGAAASTTIFVQLGRDKSKNAPTRWLLRSAILSSRPFRSISSPWLSPLRRCSFFTATGTRGAAMVVTVAPLLCMPKAFLAPIQSLLQSAERQSYVILATVLAGIVDIGIAWHSFRLTARWALASATALPRLPPWESCGPSAFAFSTCACPGCS